MTCHRHYIVLVAVRRFEALIQLIGPASAQDMIADLRDEAVRHLGLIARAQARWDHVELHVSLTAATDVSAELERLAAALARAVDLAGYAFNREPVIGAATVQHGSGPAETYGTAQLALTRARGDVRGIVLLDAKSAIAADDRFALMRGLQRAIREDALALYYQPKLRARGGEIAAAEGLLRWFSPEFGTVAPDRFIPLAEGTGDICALTLWAVRRARDDAAWLARAGVTLRLDVNMSGTLLCDADFTREVLEALASAHGGVGLEITETAMIADPERALHNLHLYAQAGIRLAIDDYGAGFSSLAYLQQLPVSEIKIDKSFIMRLTSQQRDPLLVRSTIDLAHALEVEVTAEGVDAPQTLALLQVMGCDIVQGFYLSRPLPLAELLAFVTNGGQRSRAPAQALERLRRRVEASRGRRATQADRLLTPHPLPD